MVKVVNFHRPGGRTRNRFGAMLVVSILMFLSVACGGTGETSCGIAESDYGPLTTQLGMTEDAAAEFMVDNDIDHWIEVTADGDWGPYWDQALAELGGQIHGDLTWIDVAVTLQNADGADLATVPVRVSRSYQGKIESAKQGAFEPLAAGATAAGCRIDSIVLADDTHPDWMAFDV